MKYAGSLTWTLLLFVATTVLLLLYADSGKVQKNTQTGFLQESEEVTRKPEDREVAPVKEDVPSNASPATEWISSAGLVVSSKLFTYHFPATVRVPEAYREHPSPGVSAERIKEIQQAKDILADMQRLEREKLSRIKS